ncbi:ArnT family glycosyltransferase [Oleiharenicola lentus]|uniref:ArnT family glycosyltransferase n=1 Tax=Oleiharenicola lentus TaxID=2508720 RepID=UPI003F67A0D9
MTHSPRPTNWLPWAVAALLIAGVFTLRWPSFGFRVWNVDEAIHAAVARTILDGGTLYRDTVDQRTPLTYYAVAGLFRISGENNVWAMHAFAAAIIAATAFMLFLVGRKARATLTGLWAAMLFVIFSTALFYPGDAYALNTEWFVAVFTTLAAWAFWRGSLVSTGVWLSLAFLSKQPALLDLGAPLAVLLYGGWNTREAWTRIARVLAGFLVPVLIVLAYFGARGALADFHFYAWNYNLHYYGPEIGFAERAVSAFKPFNLLATHYCLVLIAVVGALAFALFRILQQRPTPNERAGNQQLLYLIVWATSSLAGAASGGRGYDHYFIQLLPPVCLAAGFGLASVWSWVRSRPVRRFAALIAGVFLALVVGQLAYGVVKFRARAHQPIDPSVRVAEYIKAHTQSDDRIFVWGYHPDIYLFSDRKPASRFVYGSFLSGLIPWTNTAMDKDTSYAIVPGARETLLNELTSSRPAFIVDCSAGPNRYWQKYPLDTFPALRDYIKAHYQLCEAGQFVPQGFRLFQLRSEGATSSPIQNELPEATATTLAIGVLGSSVPPVQAVAPHGAGFSMIEGRAEYFAHAPSKLVYRLPDGARALRGGFGLRAAAYAPDHASPSDGAEFIIRWRASGQPEQILLRRLLQPKNDPASRGVQAFRVELPGNAEDAELWLDIEPGPADDATSDWTFWSDLLLETAR